MYEMKKNIKHSLAKNAKNAKESKTAALLLFLGDLGVLCESIFLILTKST